MTIREDSGKILLYIYKCKIEGKEIPHSNLSFEETDWNKDRLNNAIQYLIESKFVDGNIIKGPGSTKVQAAFIYDLTPPGINIIETESDFKQNFGFTVNLGLIQINWGVQES